MANSNDSHGLQQQPTEPPAQEEGRKSTSEFGEEQTQVAPSYAGSPSGKQSPRNAQPSHQRFVLADPVAFKYLAEDPIVTVLDQHRKLEGYECYLVEQWACSRTHPTFIITTYTGDPANSAIVSVLSVPTDEDTWSPRLKVYFQALTHYRAQRRETSLGILMVTNLSGFPSSLTVIPVPDGDTTKHREDFFVNENLKRLGCSGRVGLTLTKPNPATQAKFYQLYKASDKIPIYGAVIELVKLCQAALMLFGKLEPEFADGLLCDVTERSITDWWLEFGTEYYNIEPHDGILGPTTVAALLGMLVGARNRLNAYGAPVGKDVFDVESSKRAIAYFQKYQALPKSRRLDRQTVERLYRVTAKDASGGGWRVPRAVKSTVAELSGKGGEMVMDAFGGRDRAGIADVETVDIDQFVQLIHGERLKWLWYGKPRKHATSGKHGHMFDRLPGNDGLVFQKNEKGELGWSGLKRRDTSREDTVLRKRHTRDQSIEKHELQDEKQVPDGERLTRKDTHKRSSSKVNETRSGIDRIRDAVGFRGHYPKHSRDNIEQPPSNQGSGDSFTHRQDHQPGHKAIARAKEEAAEHDRGRLSPSSAKAPAYAKVFSETPMDSEMSFFPRSEPTSDVEKDTTLPSHGDSVSGPPTISSSIADSTYRGIDLVDLLRDGEGPDRQIGPLLRRTHSLSRYHERSAQPRSDAWYPRHLSFSAAEESVLMWNSINVGQAISILDDPQKELAKELGSAADAKRMREYLASLEATVADWVDRKVGNIRELEKQAECDQQELDELYYPRQEDYHILKADANEVVGLERHQLIESVKDVEVLGAKLGYEINALRSKVEDVEDGVAEFERQVSFIEGRVKELEDENRTKEGWIHWAVRLLTGFGYPPSVTEH